MSTTISPLRRITVTLALTGAAAFSAVAIAPSAFADDSTTPASSITAPAVSDPAAVTAPVVTDAAAAPAATDAAAPAATDPAVVTPAPVVPPIVYDKHGKPIKAPKVCTDKDLVDSAKKVGDATKKAAPLFSLAAASHKAAAAVRAQEVKLTTASQVNLAELVAKGLDSAGDKLAAQAKASIDQAAVLTCFIVSTPGGRF